MISFNGKDMYENCRCIAQLRKNETATMIFLKSQLLFLVLALLI